MKALTEGTKHYFVKGKMESWGLGLQAKQIKVIDVWLCYRYNEEKRRPSSENQTAYHIVYNGHKIS